MRESLQCIGRVASKGYRFDDTGICIFSYEEMCYYMRNHLICYLHTLPDRSLLTFIRDGLRLDKLYRTLCKLEDPARDQMKYFAALFREGNYYSEEEIRGILDEYRILKNAPVHQQCKWLGDLFFSRDRADMACVHYKTALKQEDLTEAERGAVHHNYGAALTRLFRFKDARIHFLKAYQYAADEKSLYYYYSIIALNEGLEKAEEEIRAIGNSDLVLTSFQEDFAQMKVAFQASDYARIFRKMYQLSEGGREEECRKVHDRFIRGLQKEFRSQIGREDASYVTSLPVAQ